LIFGLSDRLSLRCDSCLIFLTDSLLSSSVVLSLVVALTLWIGRYRITGF
jgi:hypothetical protein